MKKLNEWAGWGMGRDRDRKRGGTVSIFQTAVKPEGFLGMVPDTIIPGHTYTNTH